MLKVTKLGPTGQHDWPPQVLLAEASLTQEREQEHVAGPMYSWPQIHPNSLSVYTVVEAKLLRKKTPD
jgi:hypothetical protein